MNTKFAELIAKYADQPGDLIAAVEGLTDSELDKRPAAGKWSIREQVNHLADVEINYVQRMKKVIAEDKPLLPAFDQDRWAKSLFYDKSSVDDSIATVFTLRIAMARVLRGLNNNDFDKYGIHTENGKVTLLNLLEMAINHSEHHAKAIEKVKRKFKIK